MVSSMRFELLISLEKSSRNEGCWRIYANYEIVHKIMPVFNTGLAKVAVQCSAATFVVNQTSVCITFCEVLSSIWKWRVSSDSCL